MPQPQLFQPLAFIAAIALYFSVLSSVAAQSALTVVSFGGAYGATQNKYQVQPYREKTNREVLFESYSGGIAEIKSQVESGQIHWDVVDIESIDLERACAEGLLEVIDLTILQPGADGTPAQQDFIPEALENECGIGQMIWSTVFAYDHDKLQNTPTTIADFFDVENYPGKRGLRKRPQVNLEWALLADGVPAAKVYDLLATPEGQVRAFTKLDSIKDQIVWFDSWSQAPQLLNDGGATMVQSAHGRFYNAITQENKPFTIIWDGHIYDLDVWAIVRNSPHRDQAIDFISYSTGTAPLAGFEEVAYGPTRQSSLDLIDEKVRPHLPNAHLEQGLKANGIFWADYGEALAEQFNEWLLH